MDDKKRKKSGCQFRNDKRFKELYESAKGSSKITSFYTIPHSSTCTENEGSLRLCSQETATDSVSSLNDLQKENPVPKPGVSGTSTAYSDSVSSLNDIHSEKPILNSDISGTSATYSDYNNDEYLITTTDHTLALESSEQNSFPPSLLQSEIESKREELFPSVSDDTKDYFKRPSINDLSDFFSYHPRQPNEKDLPFKEKKTIFSVKQSDGLSFRRQWLSYKETNKNLYCFICLVYSRVNSSFCTGFDDWRHVHQRIEEHEASKAHLESVTLFMAAKQKKSTHDLLLHNQLQKRKQEVLERRHIVQVIVDVLKLIGKQGLAFRASTEQAHTFNDESINHGNFLEIIFLLSKYDPTLKNHLDAITRKSKQSHEARKFKEKETGKKSKVVGRGGFVTFLSNNTVMKIVTIIRDEMKERISASVKEAVKYSILMDTTIDISGNDQCAFVVRFVHGREVVERLLSLKCVTSTTAMALLASLSDALKEVGIPIENCVANAFDGASNMSGAYNGLTAKLSDIVPNHIHTWCYAHVLNLVLSDTAQVLPSTISFFGLLQEAQVFLKESLKRQHMYTEESPAYKLGAIGATATRWRSRSDASVKIFGRIDNWTLESQVDQSRPAKYVFYELTVALYKISLSKEFNIKVRDDASGLLRKFLSFETIITAMTFLQIFKVTTPLSDYLQTKNLDYAQAWRLVESAVSRLKAVRNGFDETLAAAKTFVSKFTEKIEASSERDTLKDMPIETDFETKRLKKVKKMAGEECDDEQIRSSPEDSFRVNVFNCIVDTVTQTMENRFVKQKCLYLDLALFDPKRFTEIKHKLPANALDKICKLIASLDKDKLREELMSFINVWPSISRKSIEQDYTTDAFESSEIYEYDKDDKDIEDNVNAVEEVEDEEDTDFSTCNAKNKCNTCIKCAFAVIVEYNMYSLQYTELYKVYKYLLTIPLTQVTCERVFSKLKLIKTRLRATMTNETLEAFILMHTERDILNDIEPDFVISKLCASSSEMRRLLSV